MDLTPIVELAAKAALHDMSPDLPWDEADILVKVRLREALTPVVAVVVDAVRTIAGNEVEAARDQFLEQTGTEANSLLVKIYDDAARAARVGALTA